MYGGLSSSGMSVSGIAAFWLLSVYGEAGTHRSHLSCDALLALAALQRPICVLVGYTQPEPQKRDQKTRPRRPRPFPPVRYVVDPYPTFNGIALDTQHNRPVMSDENRKEHLAMIGHAGAHLGRELPDVADNCPQTELGFIAGLRLIGRAGKSTQ